MLSLHGLIIRDIANQERGMFLISDSSPPEMYELHAASREDKHVWMREIHHAVTKWVHPPLGSALKVIWVIVKELTREREQIRVEECRIFKINNPKTSRRSPSRTVGFTHLGFTGGFLEPFSVKMLCQT